MSINKVDAAQILQDNYELRPIDSILYLGKSDNLSFQIVAGGNKYLWKRHNQTNISFIESELRWMEALNKDTKLRLQSPVKNKRGELVTTVVDTSTEALSHWTLQTWVEGELLSEQPTEDQLQKLAQVLVILHEHATDWTAPEGFQRDAYNEEDLNRTFQELTNNLTKDSLIASHKELLEKTLHKIAMVVRDMEKTRQTWGVIHGDIHESNYVFHVESPAILDFSSCGYGFYLYDLAQCLLHLVPENRKKLISYYFEIRSLPRDQMEKVEVFFLWAVISNFAFLSKDIEEQEGIIRAMPALVEKYCQPFLQGRSYN